MKKNILEEKLITVVIPSYNHDKYVKDAIKSIINQSYKNIELIIIDDGSKDKSIEKIKEILPECKERFKRVIFITRENKGIASTLNEAINQAKGYAITYCASDDFFEISKVEKQINFLNENRQLNLCFTKTNVIDDNNNILKEATILENSGLVENIKFSDILTFKNHLPVTGMYILSYIREIIGEYDEKLTAEDYDLNLRISKISRITFIDEKLYNYRSPAAIGGERKKPPMRKDVSESHLKSINKYKNTEFYNKALLEWNYRRFIYFSSYKKTKYYALKGALLSIGKIKDKYYLKSIIRLVILWK